MRTFKPQIYANGKVSTWEYSEKEVVEIDSGKKYTLTQPKTLFSEDFYHIKRCIAIENVTADEISEADFYVYEICFMLTGYCCNTVIVDEETMVSILSSNIKSFLQGDGLSILKNRFKK